MGFNTNTFNKSNFRSVITRKQAQFKRFQRRFTTAKNPTEKRFLKTEGNRIVTELNQLCKQWKRCGYGSHKWITRNYKVSSFSSSTTTRRSRKTHTRKSSVRRYAKRSYAKRTYARRTTRKNSRRTGWNTRYNRTNKARRSYVAW